jgi:hypothetical protein
MLGVLCRMAVLPGWGESSWVGESVLVPTMA